MESPFHICVHFMLIKTQILWHLGLEYPPINYYVTTNSGVGKIEDTNDPTFLWYSSIERILIKRR